MKGQAGSPHDGYQLLKSNENRIVLRISNSANGAAEIATKPIVSTNTWYHLAFESDDQFISLFVDGTLVGRRRGFEPRFAKDATWGSIFLGATQHGTAKLNGFIDELAFHASLARKKFINPLNNVCMAVAVPDVNFFKSPLREVGRDATGSDSGRR